MSNTPQHIATVTPAETSRYAEALALAIEQGVVAPDAKPAALALANSVWQIQH